MASKGLDLNPGSGPCSSAVPGVQDGEAQWVLSYRKSLEMSGEQ